MITRPLFLSTMLGAAVALPYVMSTEFRGKHPAVEASAGSESLGARPSGASRTREPLASLAPPPVGANPEPTSAANSRLVESPGGVAPSHDPSMALDQVINFNVTPAWVMGHWPRVSASLAELDYQGYRVPLVSGAALDDLAGSLSYYFDRSQHVAKINFQGATGDPRRLVRLVTQKFGMRQCASDEPGTVMYAVKWNNQIHSELRIRTASVVRASDARANFEVDLKLTRF